MMHRLAPHRARTMTNVFSFPWAGARRLLILATLLAAPLAHAQIQPVDKDHAARMAAGAKLFKEHLRPVLTQRCLRCHGGKATEAEFDLHSREGLLKGGTSGPAVIPGKPKESLLLRLVRHQKEPHMPQGSKQLADEVLKQIEQWIELGAAYDKPLLEKEDVAAWTRKVIQAEARKFWSFQPLRRVEPPVVKN